MSVWVGASYVLGRDVPVDEPYPHICHFPAVGRMTGVRFKVWQRDCAACADARRTVSGDSHD